MADDVHRKEAKAVRALRKGVARYAEDIRGAILHARSEAAAADQEIQREVERRRAQLVRAEQETKQLEQAASRADDSARAGLASRIAAARQREAAAQRQLDNARRAQSKIKAMQSDLLKATAAIASDVSEHSSVAASALADLDGRIRAYSHGANVFQTTVVALGIGANLLADGTGLVATGADFAKSIGVESSLVESARHETLDDYTTDQDQNLRELYADKRLEGDAEADGPGAGGKK